MSTERLRLFPCSVGEAAAAIVTVTWIMSEISVKAGKSILLKAMLQSLIAILECAKAHSNPRAPFAIIGTYR